MSDELLPRDTSAKNHRQDPNKFALTLNLRPELVWYSLPPPAFLTLSVQW